ncbi:Eaa1 [Klebsiella pneumoniae]|nr:Eaa1 [Klebsiella pneumoniae]
MTSKLTRERLEIIKSWRETYGPGSNVMLPAEEAEELACLALAAIDSKPVFFIEVDGDDWINAGRIEGKNRQDLGLLPDGINYLYAAPQPPTDAEREELQELRRSYLALRGEIEDLQAQLYEAESQADDAAEELQERRKADSEQVALQPELEKVIYHFRDWNEGFPVERFKADYVISWMLANYPPAQPAKDREQVRREHAEWSQATFGNVGPVGPLKHLSKEALEAAAEPGDLSEWADMQFLLWDAQRRAGITDEQITQAMIDKLAVNKQRSWPEPKDGEPRLHINEQPALTDNSPIIGIDLASGPDRTVEVRYVAPPGYVMVPKEPTREMLDEFDSIIDYGAEDSQDAWRRLLAATPQEVK